MSTRIEALDRLMSTVFGHQVRGEYVPCVDPNRGHLWISDDPDDQEAAIRGCHSCPALEACKTYTDQHRENAGTWAGKSYNRVGLLPKDLR